MTSPILERISTSDDLPSLPTVAVEVLRLTRNPDTRLEQISSVIEHDPAIAARMLKVVNSPLFGLSRQITSINQAIAMLGLRTVKVMALSFSLVDMTKRDVCEGFDYESYWKRSVTAAVAARLFASAASLRCGEEAFVGSLLADIGTLVAFRSAPDLYRPVLDRFREDGGELHVIEQEMLGATHARIGAKLLGDWGLPESLCKAVACHHGEGMAKPEGAPGLTDAVYCAALIAGVFCEDVASAELMNVKNVIIARLSLSPSELGEALEKLDAHVRETASLLSVQIGQTRDYGDIQREAAAELSHLSLQAEVDRAEASRREAVAREEAKRLNEEKRAILALASQDKLTRLANRAAFDERLEEEIARARQTGRPVGLIMLDIDHFKKFNDDFGHQAGDEVLRMVGGKLGEIADSVGFAARYGGEEFAVILANEAATVAEKLAELIRAALERTEVRFDGRPLKVTASIGVATERPDQGDVTNEGLISKADARLYAAKRKGRNRVVASDPEPAIARR